MLCSYLANECTFETDILKFKDKFACHRYAQAFYHSLCNSQWVNVRQAPINYIDVLSHRARDYERRQSALWRVIPRNIILAIRRLVIRIGELRKVEGKHTFVSMRRIPSWINMKLLHWEMKFYVAWKPISWIYDCSWRYAGGLVAEIRDQGEDYMDFYCSGSEGHVDDEVADDLASLGWIQLEEIND